jgi:hypothetical protein
LPRTNFAHQWRSEISTSILISLINDNLNYESMRLSASTKLVRGLPKRKNDAKFGIDKYFKQVKG